MNKELCLIGFGNQARSWALNLRDSGYKMSIGLRQSSQSADLAKNLGFEVFDYTQSLPSPHAAILTPDHTHRQVLESMRIKPEALIFAHGHSLAYGQLHKTFPQINHLLLAPKAIASELRFQYEIKGTVAGVYSCELIELERKSHYEGLIKELAADLGISSLHFSSVEDETKADLFSEQSLLCSMLPYCALYSFNKLVDKGISPTTAYFECWHEVKLIATAMVEMGPEKFFELISPNALIGSQVAKKVFFDEAFHQKLEQIYDDIDTGKFEELLKACDFERTQKEVLAFWKDSPLNQTHNLLAEQLYGLKKRP